MHSFNEPQQGPRKERIGAGSTNDPMNSQKLPNAQSMNRVAASKTPAQMQAEIHRQAVVRACEAVLLNDPQEIRQTIDHLKLTEASPELRPHAITVGRKLIKHSQEMARTGKLVMQARYSASNGSLSTLLLGQQKDPRGVIEHAVQAITRLHAAGVGMANRTHIVHLGRTEFDAQEPSTGLKIFDEQASRSAGLMSGNVMSNAQISQMIRPYSETECNDRIFSPGALREFDLKTFDTSVKAAGDRIPLKIQRAIQDNPDAHMTLYKVFHTKDRGGRHVHGWVLTESVTGELVGSIDANEGGWNASFNHHTVSIMRQAKAAYTMEFLPKTRVPLVHIEAGRVLYAHPMVVKLASAQILQHQDAENMNGSEPRDRSAFERNRG